MYPLLSVWYFKQWNIPATLYFYSPCRLKTLGCPVMSVADVMTYQDNASSLFNLARKTSSPLPFPYCWKKKLIECNQIKKRIEKFKSELKQISLIQSQERQTLIALNNLADGVSIPVFSFDCLPPAFMLSCQSLDHIAVNSEKCADHEGFECQIKQLNAKLKKFLFKKLGMPWKDLWLLVW